MLRAIAEYKKVVNAIINKHGPLDRLVIELTREVGKSFKTRKEHIDEQKKQEQQKSRAEKLCRDCKLEPNGKNILKMRLWLEQDEFCIYSGEKITISDIVNNLVEVDHIYPYSRSFDDSYLNKVLVFRSENQNKAGNTPHEFYGKTNNWKGIEARASSKKIDRRKRQRILNKSFKNREAGFKARHLTDTSYIARLVLNYTKKCLSLRDNDPKKVFIDVRGGSFTSKLRDYWGFGKKDRDLHYHHAQDAVVLAFSTKKIEQAFCEFKKKEEENKGKYHSGGINKEEYKQDRSFEAPFDKSDVKYKISKIFVSHAPRRVVTGPLHQATARSDIEIMSNNKKYSSAEKLQKAIDRGTFRRLKNGGLFDNETMVRLDIFSKGNDEQKRYFAVPIYTMDVALGVLPNMAVEPGEKEWIRIDDEYEFCFSLFKNDLICFKPSKGVNKGKEFYCYYNGFGISGNSIEFKLHDGATMPGKKTLTQGIRELESLERYEVDPLGERRLAGKEERLPLNMKQRQRKSPKKVQKNAVGKTGLEVCENADK